MAALVVAAVADRTFLVLPHPEVLDHVSAGRGATTSGGSLGCGATKAPWGECAGVRFP